MTDIPTEATTRFVTVDNLSPADFAVGTDTPNQITLRVGAGLVRDVDGVYGVDVAYIQSLVPTGDSSDGSAANRVTAIGFDQETETLTLNLGDGSQVAGGLPGIVTERRLAAGDLSRPILDAFGSDTGHRSLS